MLMFINLIRVVKNLAQKALPESDSMDDGTPYVEITSLKKSFAVVSALISGTGTRMGQVLKLSTIQSIATLPSLVLRVRFL